MKKVLFVHVLAIMAAILGGCWVPLPSNGPGDSRAHVGQAYTLSRDIFIVGNASHSWAAETDPRKRLTQVRDLRTTLKAGSRIQIDSIVSRREEMGVFYYYRCRNLAGPERFELILDMRDCLGLPPYSYLDERRKKG
jgi:hypothetical protein